MAVDYRKQYRREQLEPFWPNEILKMLTAVLCTLAVIMAFAILPVALDAFDLHGIVHAEEPADPQGTTPVGIKPEWYFLASYQYLRLMPTALFGISGKTLGVVTQGAFVAALVAVPFFYRRKAHERPGGRYRLAVTAVILGVVGLTTWGGWPVEHGRHGEMPVSFAEYLTHKPLLFIVLGLSFAVFYGLIAHERKTIRKTLYDRQPPDADGDGDGDGLDEEPT